MPPEENVTTLLYRRKDARGLKTTGADNARGMAFDPLLVFTAVLVGGALLGQLALLLSLEF